MDNEKGLAEYVLSQDGIIFRGSYKHPIPTPWNFGQVPTPTLTASLHHTSTHILFNQAGQHCARVVKEFITRSLITGKYPLDVIYEVLHNCKHAVISEHLTLKWTEIFISDSGQSGSDKARRVLSFPALSAMMISLALAVHYLSFTAWQKYPSNLLCLCTCFCWNVVKGHV